jgi:predicted NBD/HSP70 family sugar kinase/biotin operon repressor
MSASLPAGQHTVRRHNRTLVLHTVAADEPVSRARIATRTGLTRGTVSSLVEELLAAGLVAELAAARGGTGRPANPLELNRSGPGGLGVEIGVDAVGACVVDLTGAVRARRVAASDHRTHGPAVGLEAAAVLAADVVAEAGLPVTGVGLAVPGVVAGNVLERAPNLPLWRDVDIVAQAADVLGPVVGDVPVTVGNEADLAALAEQRAGGAGDDFLYVSGGIGVGAGIVLGGRLFGGSGGRAGELGHVVVDPAGPPCTCGGQGCLERAVGVEELCRAAGVDDLDALAAAAARGEPATDAALRAAGHALGVALAGAVNLLDLPTVVLGGGYPRLGAVLRTAVADELARRVVWRSPVAVRMSALGGEAALRGAALAVVRTVLDG